MTSTRCAACKYLRIRCPSDCIFSPYIPSNDPQRFAGKMLQQLPMHLRGEAADSMYYEAQCRIQEPVYGCVGIISLLHQQICDAQSELAKAQAEIAFLSADPHRHEQEQPIEAIPISFTSTRSIFA